MVPYSGVSIVDLKQVNSDWGFFFFTRLSHACLKSMFGTLELGVTIFPWKQDVDSVYIRRLEGLLDVGIEQCENWS